MNENENKDEAAEKVTAEKKKESVLSRIGRFIRALVPIKKSLVLVRSASGQYCCEIRKYNAVTAFKTAAISFLIDKTTNMKGQIGFIIRSDRQVDLVVYENMKETIEFSAIAA